jgi:predicted nucleic acid-binding protein
MPAVVVDSSVLISLAAAEQFRLLQDFYSTLLIPPAVWNEVAAVPKPFGLPETQQALADGWIMIQKPSSVAAIERLPFSLQAGETEALALALEIPHSLLLVDDAQGRLAAKTLNLAFTGTIGVLMRARKEGQISAMRPILDRLQQRTTFWLSVQMYQAVLQKVGEWP